MKWLERTDCVVGIVIVSRVYILNWKDDRVLFVAVEIDSTPKPPSTIPRRSGNRLDAKAIDTNITPAV
jgi:hypothetical protein